MLLLVVLNQWNLRNLRISLIITLVLASVSSFAAARGIQDEQLTTTYDKVKDTTTVALPTLKVSGEKDEYYSLHLATSFDYPGQTFKSPESFKFEIRSVVKGRKLNPDLYIVILIDGEQTHLSSNRWAVRNPLPGRRAIGEVIAMKMPAQMFLKLISAKESAIKMGGTRFDLTDGQKASLRVLANKANL